MSNIVVIPNSIDNVNNIINSDCYILLGIDKYSVNTLNISFDEIKNILNITNNVFLSLNKNISNSELSDVEKLLIEISKLDIKGLFYADVAIVNIVNRLKLDINLIWSAEHLTTNYFTINYWYKHDVKSTFLSNEITKDEIVDIVNNTDSKIFVQLFGFIPMYVSKRHAVKNYLNHFKLDLNSSKYYLFKEDKKYSIVDNNEGTMIYSNFIINGLKEYAELKNNIDYVIINGYDIDSNKLLSVIDIFKEVNKKNVDKLDNKLLDLFDNLDKGFLYEETIYRVKKNEK